MTLTAFKPGDTVYVVGNYNGWHAEQVEYVRFNDASHEPHHVRHHVPGANVYGTMSVAVVYPTLAEARAAALEEGAGTLGASASEHRGTGEAMKNEVAEPLAGVKVGDLLL